MKLEYYSVTCPACSGLRYVDDHLFCPTCQGVGQIIIPDHVAKPGVSPANLRNALITLIVFVVVLSWLVLR